jgi:glycosyltransferase involved in cell wall biosynthesis
MHTLIVGEALPHQHLFAKAQIRLGNTVGVYTSTPKSRIRGFPPAFDYHFVPGPIQILRGLAMNKLRISRKLYDWDSDFFDKLTARAIGDSAVMLGAATSSLYTGRAAQKRGSKYLVDRACPDIRVQEQMLVDEAAKVGGTFPRAPQWFVDRQVAEYEEADFIVCPSEYSKRSFPKHLHDKTILARLAGSVRSQRKPQAPQPRPFTVGVVGGDALRKGYLYLLQAWKELGWKDARLLLRTDPGRLGGHPGLAKLLEGQDNIEIVSYFPDIADFYSQCDVFILPSIDEGFGLALFEALGQGVPCVATTNCGAAELLTSEEQFLLIEPFSSVAIKDALTRLRESPELRHRIGEAGAKYILESQAGVGSGEYFKGVEELMTRAFPAAPAAVPTLAHATV